MVTKVTKLADIASTYPLQPLREERAPLPESPSREELSGQFIPGQDIVRRVILFDAKKERAGLRQHIITAKSGVWHFGKTNWNGKMNRSREARVTAAIDIFERTTLSTITAIQANFERIKQLTEVQRNGRFSETRLIELITLAASGNPEDLSLKKIQDATDVILRDVEYEEYLKTGRTEGQVLSEKRSVSVKFQDSEELMDNMEPHIDELIFLLKLQANFPERKPQEYLPSLQARCSLTSLAYNYSLISDALAHEKQLLEADTAAYEAAEKRFQEFFNYIEQQTKTQKVIEPEVLIVCQQIEEEMEKVKEEMEKVRLRMNHHEKRIKFLELALSSNLEPLKTARTEDQVLKRLASVKFQTPEELMDNMEPCIDELIILLKQQESFPSIQTQCSLISLAYNYSLIFDALAHENKLLAKETAAYKAAEKRLQELIEDSKEDPQKLLMLETCQQIEEEEMGKACLRMKHCEKRIEFLELALSSNLEPLKTAREKDDAAFVEAPAAEDSAAPADEDPVEALEEEVFVDASADFPEASSATLSTEEAGPPKPYTTSSPDLLEAASPAAAAAALAPVAPPVDDNPLTQFVDLLIDKISPIMMMTIQLLPKDLIKSVDIKEEDEEKNGKKYTVTLTFKDEASGVIGEIWNIKDTKFHTSKTMTVTVLPKSKELIFEEKNLSACIDIDKIGGLSVFQKCMLPSTMPVYLSKITLQEDKKYLSIQGTLDLALSLSSSILMDSGDMLEVSANIEWDHHKKSKRR